MDETGPVYSASMSLSVRALAAFTTVTLLAGACASAVPDGTPSASAAPTAGSNPTSAGSASPAAAAMSPIPSADVAHPVGIIAVGHSGLTGEGTGAGNEPVEANSWATGTDPQVDSVYLRMVAALPATEGHASNTAVGGALAESLSPQARAALADVPAPALAIIQTVDNDIRCDAANVKDVGASVADVLALIHGASRNTKILVAGQLGRPSVAFVQDLVAHDPSKKRGLTWGDDCTFFDSAGKIHQAGFHKLTAAIDAYEAETARVCAAVPNCVTDGGVRRAWIDKIDLFSPVDDGHLNKQGQAAEAKQIWPVVEKLLGE